MLKFLSGWFGKQRLSPSYPTLPFVKDDGESNIPGLFLLGDVAGKPLIKVGLNDGFDLAERLADELGDVPDEGVDYLVAVLGAGVAGSATAVRLKERGISVVAIDAGRSFQTLRNFTKGKVLFAEPHSMALRGSLPFVEGDTADVLVGFDAALRQSGIELREHTKVMDVRRDPAGFRVVTERGELTARRVVMAIGKAGNPRKAGVPGELEYPEGISHYLKDPADFVDQQLVIYGGGDVAAEAALALCENNRVTLVTIDEQFVFPKKRNVDAMRAREADGQLTLLMNTQLSAIGPEQVAVEHRGTSAKQSIPYDHIFEMIGAELPLGLFSRIGIKLSGSWDLRRWITLLVSSVLVFGIYAWAKGSKLGWYGVEMWGLKGVLPWPMNKPSFYYSALYTLLMTVFGLKAMKRWSRDWTDSYQIKRFASLICFQILSFVGIEIILSIYFPNVWWRAYAINNPFPLLFDSFYNMSGVTRGSAAWVFVGIGALMTFVVIPIAVRWHGKRFCTWICGCGGLAETLGDQWRHLSPKGERSRRLEGMGTLVLFWSLISAGVILFVYHGDTSAAGRWHGAYSLIADFWLVAVIPVALYPIWGGKVWCRYWCPLAKYMQVLSKWYGKLAIGANDKCIQCTECSKQCQVGVDVMQFAKNGLSFSNRETSCIHCGICITACPMDVLAFEYLDAPQAPSTVEQRGREVDPHLA